APGTFERDALAVICRRRWRGNDRREERVDVGFSVFDCGPEPDQDLEVLETDILDAALVELCENAVGWHPDLLEPFEHRCAPVRQRLRVPNGNAPRLLVDRIDVRSWDDAEHGVPQSDARCGVAGHGYHVVAETPPVATDNAALHLERDADILL